MLPVIGGIGGCAVAMAHLANIAVDVVAVVYLLEDRSCVVFDAFFGDPVQQVIFLRGDHYIFRLIAIMFDGPVQAP